MWILAERCGFLGHVIFVEGIFVYPRNVKAILKWKKPTNILEIHSFLGLVGYYWRFIVTFLTIATPLTRLTKMEIKWGWSRECEKIFQELKRSLTTAPVLTLPFEIEGFVVYSDTSKKRLSCFLMQHGKVITYASRQLKSHEVNYGYRDITYIGLMYRSLQITRVWGIWWHIKNSICSWRGI